jgi:hypothetical protein
MGWVVNATLRALRPGKTQYPLYRRLGGPQGRNGWVQKISLPPGFDLWTVQPGASRCTDWASRPYGITVPALIHNATNLAKIPRFSSLIYVDNTCWFIYIINWLTIKLLQLTAICTAAYQTYTRKWLLKNDAGVRRLRCRRWAIL